MKHNIIVIIPLLFMSAVSEKVIDLSRVCDGFDEGFAKCVFAGRGTYVNTRVSREVRRLKIDSLRNSQISTVNLPNLEWIESDNPQFDNKAACEHIAVPFWRTIRVEFKDVIHRCTPMSASSSEKTRPDVITSQTTTAQETTEDSSLRHQMTERSTVMTSQTTTSLETTDHSSSRHQMTEPTTIQPVTPEPTTTKLHSNDGTTQDNDHLIIWIAISSGIALILLMVFIFVGVKRKCSRKVSRSVIESSSVEEFNMEETRFYKRKSL